MDQVKRILNNMKASLEKNQDTVKTVSNMLLFFILFSVLGQVIPDTYFKYFDNTQYYKISSPVDVDQDYYKVCDRVLVHLNRTALVNTDAQATVELVLLRDNIEVDRHLAPLAIEKGQQVVSFYWSIPCDADPGIYYYRGIVTYEVRKVDHHATFYSENFTVTK